MSGVSSASHGGHVRRDRSVILLIDDDPQIHKAVRRLLERVSDVLSAVDGEQGLAMLAEHRDVELVLLDLRMPGRHGDVVLADIHARFPRLPVVMVSGSLDAELKRRLLASGAAACVDKDMIATELVELVRSLIA